jgi:hypothetical protein
MPTAHRTKLAFAFGPSTAVDVRCFVALRPAVRSIFLHVAMHVMQAEGIGCECADRQSLLPELALNRVLIGARSIEVRLI